MPLSIEKGTKPVAGRIGPRFQGAEDEFWVLKGGETPDNLSDTSYTNLALEPHTDGTFFSVAPGYVRIKLINVKKLDIFVSIKINYECGK